MKQVLDSVTPESLIIGLVMDYFNPELLEGARTYANTHGIELDTRWSLRSDWLPENLNWDGILHGLVDDRATTAKIKKSPRLPEISLVGDDSFFSVIPDYKACGQLAVDELARYGAKHILTFNLTPRHLDQCFMEGSVMSCQKNGLSYSESVYKSGSFRIIIDEIVQKIDSLPKPLGLSIPHADVAYSMTRALLKKGWRVPEDISIVVIDKDPNQIAALAPVPLTAVTLSEWRRGFVAIEALHQLILGIEPKRQTTLIQPSGIHGRASTGYVEVQDPAMAKALSFLRTNYQKRIGVPEIVMASGTSRRTLEIRFRKILNCSVREELQRIRIEDAKHHLEKNILSVTDIAQVCGFSSMHYFSRAFKREIGVSPKHYQLSL